LISRFIDLVLVIPAIVLVGVLSRNSFGSSATSGGGGNWYVIALFLGLVGWPSIARVIRGMTLSLREKEFVEAAISQGASPLRVMFSELLPNITSSLLVFFTLIIANNIVLEAALSFLGAGVQPPTPSWGTLISDGQTLIVTRPWLALAPGLAIVLTVLSLNVFGDGLRDALDPRAKVRVEH
jgi:peptide/nickel transport system permease protein